MFHKSVLTILTLMLALGISVSGAGASGKLQGAPTILAQAGKQVANQSTPGQGSPLTSLGTGFTYQGRLTNGGAAANGQYDLIFALWDAASAGTRVGSQLTMNSQSVTDGLFTVTLDFGASAFQGQARWLEIQVRQSGVGAYTTLAPRGAITAVPYAMSLIPGAVVTGTLAGPALTLSNTAGIAMRGESQSLSQPAIYGLNNNDIGVQGDSTTGIGILGNSNIGYGLYGSSNTGVGLYASSMSGQGVIGSSNSNKGVSGSSNIGYGVYGSSATSYAIYGTTAGASSTASGVYGTTPNNSGVGVMGEVTGTSAYAVWGKGNGGTGTVGVFGSSSTGKGVVGSSFSNIGGYFTSNSSDGAYAASTSGNGLAATTSATTGNMAGVYGLATGLGGNGLIGEANYGGNAYGVWGKSTTGFGIYGSSAASGETTLHSGVYGVSTGSYGYGVIGVATDYLGTGIYGQASGAGFAGYFEGNVGVNGNFHAGGSCCQAAEGTFQIDHPLDPANKYLNLAAVASADMLDIQNGNVTTDAKGEATVQLPSYFEALNSDYRYQLTVVGQFAQAIIGSKIKDNHFTIKTDKPNVEVSWQVTGIRHDPYAEAHPITTEQSKPANERGYYLHPELYGQPNSKQIDYGHHVQTGQADQPTK